MTLGAGGRSLHIRLGYAGTTMQMTLPVVPVVSLVTMLMEMRSFPSQVTQYATVNCKAQAYRPKSTEEIRSIELNLKQTVPFHVPWQLLPQLMPCFAYCLYMFAHQRRSKGVQNGRDMVSTAKADVGSPCQCANSTGTKPL